MSGRRLLLAVASIAMLAVPLTACARGGPAASGEGEDLVNTAWSGLDSDGTEWGIFFESDGTLLVNYAGTAYDDGTDTWVVEDGVLHLHVQFDDGDSDMSGEFDGLDEPIELTNDPGAAFTFTLTLEQN